MLQIKITVIEIQNDFDGFVRLLDAKKKKKKISGLEDSSIGNPQTEMKKGVGGGKHFLKRKFQSSKNCWTI